MISSWTKLYALHLTFSAINTFVGQSVNIYFSETFQTLNKQRLAKKGRIFMLSCCEDSGMHIDRLNRGYS